MSTSFTFREVIYTVDCPRISEWTPTWRPDPVARQCYISPLILSLHETLEVLHVPIAMAPLTEMESIGWPRLRELKLYGESYDNGEDPAVFARLCAKIPCLRVLDFCFLHRGRAAQTLIRPSNLPFPASFEHLESVDICYPDPSDTLYNHLPSHLRRLHLIDRPRYYYFQEGDPVVRDNYTSQTLGTATDTLAILKKLRGTPFVSLESLGLAFQTDVQESALLAYIVAIFPNLRFLQIHRYRSEGETTADMESVLKSIARSLSSLQSLRHFRVYLNIPDDDYLPPLLPGQKHSVKRMTGSEFMSLLHHYSTIITASCSSQLLTIDFLTTWIFGDRLWTRCDIRQDNDGNPVLDISRNWLWHPSCLDDSP
ncbi:hypothetical protein EVG20_g10523 [Dentipellis fragilis]|uniref:F-box domain-containing protein n=1 Tax=Dentipellis fragilis TaxID=205917 RepID=A0A4Y9XRX6_9AGAM|nr:hypothetical protein EVG20_g10523 [Dentipellis fragilis]